MLYDAEVHTPSHLKQHPGACGRRSITYTYTTVSASFLTGHSRDNAMLQQQAEEERRQHQAQQQQAESIEAQLLHAARDARWDEMLRILGDRPDLVTLQSKYSGWGPIHQCAMYGNTKVCPSARHLAAPADCNVVCRTPPPSSPSWSSRARARLC